MATGIVLRAGAVVCARGVAGGHDPAGEGALSRCARCCGARAAPSQLRPRTACLGARGRAERRRLDVRPSCRHLQLALVPLVPLCTVARPPWSAAR